MIRGIFRVLAALAITLVAVVALAYVRHLVLVAELREAGTASFLSNVDDKVPAEALREIGFFGNRKVSSFVHFPAEKPADVRRICALGDSFTEGEETGGAFDYPSLLQRRLDRERAQPFEVLNFGNSWFGFHQAFLVWTGIARDYDCDVVLLGPATFFPRRETSFNHAGKANPFFFHSRFVLRPGSEDVEQVDVHGETIEERFDTYFRFVPPIDYLRYDTKTPRFLAALLPDGWELPNPFYYFEGSIEEEAHLTYAILLARLTKEAPYVGVAAPHGMRDTLWRVKARNLGAFAVTVPRSFPYLAPRGHYGPVGNDLLARMYWNHLFPTPVSLPVLRTTDLPISPDASRPAAPALSAYGRASIRIGDDPLGTFAMHGADGLFDSGALLREKAIISLVAIALPERPSDGTGSRSILDACWLPVDRALTDGEEVTLVVDGQARGYGQISRMGGQNVGRIVRSGVDRLVIEAGRSDVVLAGPAGRAEVVELRLGDRLLFSSPPGRPADGAGECLWIRAAEDGFVDLDEVDADGMVELVLTDDRGGDVRVPLATWQKIELSSPPSLVEPRKHPDLRPPPGIVRRAVESARGPVPR